MSKETVSISSAVEILEDNLMKVARVMEWADLMGYKNPKRFSRKFLRYHEVRPQRMLEFVRLKSITCDLRNNNASNFEIARAHDIPDEKALNKFTNYHLGCSPTDLKMMSEYQLEETLEKFDRKIR